MPDSLVFDGPVLAAHEIATTTAQSGQAQMVGVIHALQGAGGDAGIYIKRVFHSHAINNINLEVDMANEGALFADPPARTERATGGHHPATDRVMKTPFGAVVQDEMDAVARTKGADTATNRPSMRRLSLNLPETLYEDLSDLAESQGKSMTEIVRTGLGLAHIAYAQVGKRNKLMISDSDGRPIREILIPR